MTDEERESALTAPNPDVRLEAVLRGGLTPEQLARARDDDDAAVHQAAVEYEEPPPEQDCKALYEALYEGLAKPLPEEGIQRTAKEQTHKGYDTTGYGYQYVVDRLNEVCGLDGWGFEYEMVDIQKGAFKSGAPYFETTVMVGVWVGQRENVRRMPGGHISTGYRDALKGAVTNGLKAAAATFGVGAAAYRGAIDPDTEESESRHERRPDTGSKGSAVAEGLKKQAATDHGPIGNRRLSDWIQSFAKPDEVDAFKRACEKRGLKIQATCELARVKGICTVAGLVSFVKEQGEATRLGLTVDPEPDPDDVFGYE